jgi:CRP-like cAMP-binding protein
MVRPAGGGEVRLAALGAGDVFGEMSMLTRGAAMATIRAEGKCWALLLGRDRFQELILTHPHVLAFISDLVERREAENRARLSSERPFSDGQLRVY